MEQMVEGDRAVLKLFDGIGRDIASNPHYPGAPYWRMALPSGKSN